MAQASDDRPSSRAIPGFEDAYRVLVDSILDDAISLLDPDGRILTWNRGGTHIEGWEAHEIVGQHFSVFYTDEDRARGKPAIALESALRTGHFQDEGYRVRKDGSRFWASVGVTPIRGTSGELRGFAKVTRDLTARKRAEETARELAREQAARAAAEQAQAQLRASEESYRALSSQLETILQGVGDGISVQDRNGVLRFANRAAARQCGFATPEEMLSAGRDEIVARFETLDDRGAPMAREQLPGRLVLEGEEQASAVVGVRERATGRVWWSHVRASPVRDANGQPRLAISIWQDITNERRSEEARRYLDHATLTLSSSLDYEVTLAALARELVPHLADWCAIDLWEDEQLKRVAVAHVDLEKVRFAHELNERYPPDLSPGAPGIASVLATGRAELYPDITDEMLVAGAVDEEHLAISRALGLRSAIVAPIKVRDVTFGAMTLIAAESGRRYDVRDEELATELGRRAGTAIENARLFRDARRAVELRDDFLSIAGHELRTPLAALDLQLHGLRRALARDGAFDLAKWTERVDKTLGHSKRLQRLINELLDVSRITSHRLELLREHFDLVSLLREILERHEELLARAGCVVNLDVQGDASGEWDRSRVDQVLTNVLDNAVKYGKGAPIDIVVRGDEDRVIVTVHDRGIGIAPEHHERIFGRFERAVSVRHYGGLGLGLWIAREIVEAHGGKIRFESAEGQGATFTIELPRREASA